MTRLKLAIQKSGRLHEDSIKLLQNDDFREILEIVGLQ